MIRTFARKFSKISKGKDMFYPKYGTSFYEYSEKDFKNTNKNYDEKKVVETIKLGEINYDDKKIINKK